MLTTQAQVTTPKALRYLKALCNHFDRKVTAHYEDTHGSVQFGFGSCELDAAGEVLTLRVEAENAEDFERVKHVMADHLERFAAKDEALQVEWTEQA